MKCRSQIAIFTREERASIKVFHLSLFEVVRNNQQATCSAQLCSSSFARWLVELGQFVAQGCQVCQPCFGQLHVPQLKENTCIREIRKTNGY